MARVFQSLSLYLSLPASLKSTLPCSHPSSHCLHPFSCPFSLIFVSTHLSNYFPIHSASYLTVSTISYPAILSTTLSPICLSNHPYSEPSFGRKSEYATPIYASLGDMAQAGDLGVVAVESGIWAEGGLSLAPRIMGLVPSGEPAIQEDLPLREVTKSFWSNDTSGPCPTSYKWCDVSLVK